MPTYCPYCGAQALTDAVVDRTAKIQYEGKLHQVRVPSLEVKKCSECNEIVLDNRADEQYLAALRKKLRLLTPREIRVNRRNRKLTQEQLADLLKITAESLSRWENGHVIQSRSHDTLLRAFFELPEFQRFAQSRLDEAAAIPSVAGTWDWDVRAPAQEGKWSVSTRTVCDTELLEATNVVPCTRGPPITSQLSVSLESSMMVLG